MHVEATTTPSLPARERLLEAATRLFYQHGIHSVGIDRIIAEAGIAKMTFYNHFPSKDELIAEVIRRKDKNWRESMQRYIDERAVTEPLDIIMAFFDYMKEWFESDTFRGCQFLNTSVDLADRDHPAFQAVLDQQKFSREFLRNLLDQAGIRNAEDLADQLIILMAGAIMNAYVLDSSKPALSAKRAAQLLIAKQGDDH